MRFVSNLFLFSLSNPIENNFSPNKLLLTNKTALNGPVIMEKKNKNVTKYRFITALYININIPPIQQLHYKFFVLSRIVFMIQILSDVQVNGKLNEYNTTSSLTIPNDGKYPINNGIYIGITAIFDLIFIILILMVIKRMVPFWWYFGAILVVLMNKLSCIGYKYRSKQ
eukprot:69568_1